MYSGKNVCGACLEDQALKQFAHERGAPRKCDYCNGALESGAVVSLIDVIDFMRKAILVEWCPPEKTDSYSSAAEGYLAEIFDAHELFEEIGFSIANAALMGDITDAFANQEWCRRNWDELPVAKRCLDAWENFQYFVKHKQRYTFWHAQDYGEDLFARCFYSNYLPPSKLLDEIGAIVNREALVKPAPAGTLIWRLRPHASRVIPAIPDGFTSPPVDYANQPNRMSPAGVPMFYGADEFDTAFRELIDLESPGPDLVGKAISGLQFRNVIPLNFLDLTSVPDPPSYFSTDDRLRRQTLIFLKKFASEVAQPIKRDGRQHIEYVPTQVFTEFVRFILKDPTGAPIHGIRYKSSKDGRPCCVIFATEAECLPPHGPLDFTTQLLEFVPGSLRTVAVPSGFDFDYSCQGSL